MTDDNTLWIVAQTEEPEADIDIEGRRSGQDVGGGFSPSRTIDAVRTVVKRQRVSLDANALKTQMEGLLAIINSLFDQATTQTGLQLNEVELSVEINAEGQVSLVGNGVKLGNTGGITLKFVRPDGKTS